MRIRNTARNYIQRTNLGAGSASSWASYTAGYKLPEDLPDHHGHQRKEQQAKKIVKRSALQDQTNQRRIEEVVSTKGTTVIGGVSEVNKGKFRNYLFE